MMTNRDQEHPGMDEDARLANRATWLTLLSLMSLLVALLTVPLTFQSTDRTLPRLAASSPLAVGVGTGLLARAARSHLRALRGGAAPGERADRAEPRASSAAASAGPAPDRDRSA